MCSSSRSNFSLRGHSANTPSSIGDEGCNFPLLHLSSSMPVANSSLFFQNQAEVNKFCSLNQRFSGTVFSEVSPLSSESSKVAGSKRSHFDGHIPNVLMDKGVASRFDDQCLSSESPLVSTLTEDDFLDMVFGKISPPLINYFAFRSLYYMLFSCP